MNTNIKFCFNYLIIIAVITMSVISLFTDISISSKKSEISPEIDRNHLGQLAAIGEFPYHVSIQYDGKHKCCGAFTGFTYTKMFTDLELRNIFVFVSDNATCRKIFGDEDLTKVFCASVAPEYSGGCAGISRGFGDIAIENKSNIIGISFPGLGPCFDGTSLHFTYVPNYLPFIESQMNRID